MIRTEVDGGSGALTGSPFRFDRKIPKEGKRPGFDRIVERHGFVESL
jgi:hypothetical protein